MYRNIGLITRADHQYVLGNMRLQGSVEPIDFLIGRLVASASKLRVSFLLLDSVYCHLIRREAYRCFLVNLFSFLHPRARRLQVLHITITITIILSACQELGYLLSECLSRLALTLADIPGTSSHSVITAIKIGNGLQEPLRRSHQRLLQSYTLHRQYLTTQQSVERHRQRAVTSQARGSNEVHELVLHLHLALDKALSLDERFRCGEEVNFESADSRMWLDDMHHVIETCTLYLRQLDIRLVKKLPKSDDQVEKRENDDISTRVIDLTSEPVQPEHQVFEAFTESIDCGKAHDEDDDFSIDPVELERRRIQRQEAARVIRELRGAIRGRAQMTREREEAVRAHDTAQCNEELHGFVDQSDHVHLSRPRRRNKYRYSESDSDEDFTLHYSKYSNSIQKERHQLNPSIRSNNKSESEKFEAISENKKDEIDLKVKEKGRLLSDRRVMASNLSEMLHTRSALMQAEEEKFGSDSDSSDR